MVALEVTSANSRNSRRRRRFVFRRARRTASTLAFRIPSLSRPTARSFRSNRDFLAISPASREYDAFGTIIPNSATGTWPNRFGYQGQAWIEIVSANGSQRLLASPARIYDPVDGRFLQNEPLPLRRPFPHYLFCLQNPVNMIDRLGLQEQQCGCPEEKPSTRFDFFYVNPNIVVEPNILDLWPDPSELYFEDLVREIEKSRLATRYIPFRDPQAEVERAFLTTLAVTGNIIEGATGTSLMFTPGAPLGAYLIADATSSTICTVASRGGIVQGWHESLVGKEAAPYTRGGLALVGTAGGAAYLKFLRGAAGLPGVPINPRNLANQIQRIRANVKVTGGPPCGVRSGTRAELPPGWVATWENRPIPRGILPQGTGRIRFLPYKDDPLYYMETDVWPLDPFASRGEERLIFGRGGEVFYTPDHYRSFFPLSK